MVKRIAWIMIIPVWLVWIHNGHYTLIRFSDMKACQPTATVLQKQNVADKISCQTKIVIDGQSLG